MTHPAPNPPNAANAMGAAAALTAGSRTAEEALALFDSLEPVDIDFMIGAWKGKGFHTGHPLDGILEAYHWHGKRFESAEAVHPLVFTSLGGTHAPINPRAMAPSVTRLGLASKMKAGWLGKTFQLLMPLFRTRRSGARLRMTVYRGKLGATMIYDELPINDVFRRLDDDTVLGAMDLKGLETPLFFVLRRESAPG